VPAADPGRSPPPPSAPRPASEGDGPAEPVGQAEVPRATPAASPPSIPIPGSRSDGPPPDEPQDRPARAETPADPVPSTPGATTGPSAPTPAADPTASASAPDARPEANPADQQAASDSPAAPDPGPPTGGSDTPEGTAGRETKAQSSRSKRAAKPPAPPAEEVGPLAAAPGRPGELETYLAWVTQTILELFRGRDDERRALLDAHARVQKDNEQLQAEVAASRQRLEALTGELEEARHVSGRAHADADQRADRVRELEARLAASEEAARGVEARARQLETDVEDALNEVAQAERRAGDQIYRAQKEKEQAVKTFVHQLRQRMEPLLSEVLDDPQERPELNPEQSRLHQHLSRIVDTLRDLELMSS
jgi:hypothetical protein